MKSLSCANQRCPRSGKTAAERIIRHGFYKTRWGKRRRYQCRICGKTFCSTTATPYHRLQHRRATFEEVAALSLEGLNKSAIARVQTDRMEHSASLARKSGCLVSPVQ